MYNYNIFFYQIKKIIHFPIRITCHFETANFLHTFTQNKSKFFPQNTKSPMMRVTNSYAIGIRPSRNHSGHILPGFFAPG